MSGTRHLAEDKAKHDGLLMSETGPPCWGQELAAGSGVIRDLGSVAFIMAIKLHRFQLHNQLYTWEECKQSNLVWTAALKG